MEKDGFKFDFETQRFLKNRWETEVGQQVRKEIINGIKESVELRAILDDYVLDHPENIDPYAYPIYPKSEMDEGRFWVLTQDDLRGINIYSEDLSSSPCLQKKNLSYSYFHNCNLSNADIQRSDLSYATFEKCYMEGVVLAGSGGFNIELIDCNLTNACFWQSGFRESDFSGSTFSGVYFEKALLEDIKVNYKTQFDLTLSDSWNIFNSKNIRNMPQDQKPDILRAIRIAYNKAELWGLMDAFLFEEKVAQRKYILWPLLKRNKSKVNSLNWLGSLFSELLSGYSTKPSNVIIMALFLAIAFAGLYLFAGTPNHSNISIPAALEALYFSFTTYATLGYGDISYNAGHPYIRLLSTVEAWVGAITISLFVVVLSRKLFR
jgi:hypothetical protein